MNQLVPQQGNNPNLPAAWEDKMAMYAKEGLANERSPGQLFSTKSGILTFGGTAVPNNTMQVCVVAAMFENVFYPRPYNADAPESPDCYAFSFDGKNMSPHDDAEDKQSPLCDTCKQAEWVLNPRTGKDHKPCKEQRRLAVIPAGALGNPEDVAKATMGYLRLPVTSTKAFSEHVKQVGVRALPIFAVVTEVKLSPDPKVMWRFSFSLVSTIADASVLDAIEKRHFAERASMAFPYPKNAKPEPATGTVSGAQQRKF